MWSPASREHRRPDRQAPDRRSRRRVLAPPATAVVIAALALPAGARADVLLQPLVGDPGPLGRPATLVAPDGTRRVLAAPGGAPADAYQFNSVSPDRRLIGRASGTRVVLLPTDGGAARVVGRHDLRPPATERQLAPDPGIGHPDGSFGLSVAVGGPDVWWDADGTHVRRDGVRNAAGTPVVVACTVATGLCVQQASPPGLGPLGVRADGGSLWTADTPPAVERIFSGPLKRGAWVRATPAAVRRARAALRRPYPDALVLVAPDGGRRTLWRSQRSFARGVTSFHASAGGTGGTIVTWKRAASVLETRRRKGRPQARLRTRTVATGAWRISPTGQRSTFRARTVAGEHLESVTAPAGPHGWYGTLRDRRGLDRSATIGADGTVREVLLGGHTLTLRALRGALGLAPVRASASPKDDALRASVAVSGYEVATDSLVVTVYATEASSELRQLVARVPLAGGSPSAVDTGPDAPADNPQVLLVSAW